MKNKFKLIKLVLAGSAIVLTSTYSLANTIISETAAIQGIAGSIGLIGTFWSVPSGSTKFNVADTIAASNSYKPSGTFFSSSINYSGTDHSTINQFLGTDALSYSAVAGSSNSMSDGILQFKGFIHITSPSEINFSLYNDDSAQLIIGNEKLIFNNTGKNNFLAKFTKTGFYAVDLLYSNTNWEGGQGGAMLKLTTNGGSTNGFSQSVSAVPEPETYAMLLTGLGLMGFALRRRKTA